MARQVKLEFFDAGSMPDRILTYVVIGALEKGQWIFVRHADRETWELPAGHIEYGEPAIDAARRELYEETGTTSADVSPLADYAVDVDGDVKYGRVYFASVEVRGPKPESEIAEVVLRRETPLPATYPVAHKAFLQLLEKQLKR